MKYIYILDQNTFSLFCICILAKIKIQKISNKEKIHNEGNINRASAKEQGLLLAGTAGCFSGGDLDQDQVTPLGFFCRQQNISMSLKRLCFFLDGRSCTVSSKQSSWRNAALGLGKTLAMAMDGLDDGVSNGNEGSFRISNTNNFVFGLEYLSTSVFHQPQYIAILPSSLDSLLPPTWTTFHNSRSFPNSHRC